MSKYKKNLVAKIKDRAAEVGVQFYVTYWNPNGTNDLLLVREGDSEMIDSLQEFCFGIDAINHDDQFGIHSYHNHVTVFDSSDDLMTAVRFIELDAVLESIAISPVKSESNQLGELLYALEKISQ